MSAPFRRPNASDKSSYLDGFDEFKNENMNGGSGARTLKPPPEILELVHPVPSQQFKPSQALVGRIATPKVMLMAVAIAAALGGGVAAWKFQAPQKVAAIFREPDAPVRKSAPATATVRHTPVETPKSNQTSVGSTTPESTAVQNEPNVNLDVVPTTAAVVRRVVKKPAKPSLHVADVAAPNSNGAVGTTPGATVTTKPKEQQTPTEQNATGSRVGNRAGETSAAKPKALATSSPQATASTPAKANPTPKPKVIQWP